MRLTCALVVCAGLLATGSRGAEKGVAEHVVVVVWDGMRPDFITPLRLSQHGRVRGNFQVVAGIASGRQIDRAAHGPCGIQRLLDGFRIRRLAVAFCAEIRLVENGSSLRPESTAEPSSSASGPRSFFWSRSMFDPKAKYFASP